MEPGTRWTLAVVALAVGVGFGLVHVVWRASSVDPAAPVTAPAPAAPAVIEPRAVWHSPPQGSPPGPPAGMVPAAAGRGAHPGALYPPYGVTGEGFRAWPPTPEPVYSAYPPQPAYPAWGGLPEPPYGAYPQGPRGYESGYPAYPPTGYPAYPGPDAATWWAPEFHDGPPPPEPQAWAEPPGSAAGLAEPDGAARAPMAPGDTSEGLLPGVTPEAGFAAAGAPMGWDASPVPAPEGAGIEPPSGIDQAGSPQPVAPFVGPAIEPGPAPPNP